MTPEEAKHQVWLADDHVIAERVQAVLDLHQPDEYGDCTICVEGAYHGDIVTLEWPCPTVRLLAGQETS